MDTRPSHERLVEILTPVAEQIVALRRRLDQVLHEEDGPAAREEVVGLWAMFISAYGMSMKVDLLEESMRRGLALEPRRAGSDREGFLAAIDEVRQKVLESTGVDIFPGADGMKDG